MATILLVDDDDFVRRMVRTALERAGYNVVEAATPGEALELCRTYAGPIELVLTDVLLPQMRGTDLVPLLISRRPELRVLYMSGFPGDGRRPEPLLEKPFPIASLQHAIADGLAEPRAA